MRPRNDVVKDAWAVTNIEQLVRAAMVRCIPPLVVPASVPPRLVSATFPVGSRRVRRMTTFSPTCLTFSFVTKRSHISALAIVASLGSSSKTTASP